MASARTIALQLEILVKHSLRVFAKLGVHFLFHLVIEMASAKTIALQLEIQVQHSRRVFAKLGVRVN